MFGFGTGSKEAKFQHSQESPDGTGELCCLSNPIDDMTPEQFWDALEDWLLNKGVLSKMWETAYEIKKADDGALVTITTYGTKGSAVSWLAGELSGTLYTKYYINREENTMKSYNYNTDATMSQENLSSENVLKVHPEPFRFEFYVNELHCRLCGPFVKSFLDKILIDCGMTIETTCSAPSPSEPGAKAIVSDVITDPEFSFEGLWGKYKDFMISGGGTVLDNGMVIMENTAVISDTTYISSGLNDAKDLIVTRNHGTDDSLTEIKFTFYQKLISEPTRIEMWMENHPNRGTGPAAVSWAEMTTNIILRHARGEKDEPPKEG